MTKLGARFLILVLAIMDLSDQQPSIALDEFERTLADASELFLSLLENYLDRTIICVAFELGAMRFTWITEAAVALIVPMFTNDSKLVSSQVSLSTDNLNELSRIKSNKEKKDIQSNK